MNPMYEKLREHFGHHIEIIQYGNDDNPIEFTIECEDCCCVLVSSEDYEDQFHQEGKNHEQHQVGGNLY